MQFSDRPGGGFKYLVCSSIFGKMIKIDEYFSDGLVQQLFALKGAPSPRWGTMMAWLLYQFLLRMQWFDLLGWFFSPRLLIVVSWTVNLSNQGNLLEMFKFIEKIRHLPSNHDVIKSPCKKHPSRVFSFFVIALWFVPMTQTFLHRPWRFIPLNNVRRRTMTESAWL